MVDVQASAAVRLSVVVGTFNRRERLQACIESIFDQTTTPTRIYVTDAGSTDGTIEYLRGMASDRLVPVFEGRRLGQARAYNEAFARVETPYVCWLSDDNVVVSHGLDTAAKILDDNPSIGMVGLKVKDVRGPFAKAPYIGGVSDIGILNVNQGLLRSPLLRAVGGFSEAFRDYGIDPDLTAKVLFSGHTVVYTRGVAIHHYRNWGADLNSEEFSRQMERQEKYRKLYLRKYAGFSAGSMTWRARKRTWGRLKRALGVSLHSERTFLGLVPRDWHNVFAARYVSLLDPLRYRGRAYYLVQRCPARQRPKCLPPDPPERPPSSTASDEASLGQDSPSSASVRSL